MTPTRIQLSRQAGWRMPENTVIVDRRTDWGNPFVSGIDGATLEDCLASYEAHARQLDLAPLRGKNLACWCALDQPCHADILLRLANENGEIPGLPTAAALPYFACSHSTVYLGDALWILRSLPDASVDAIVTDPPYSSGGFTRSDRNLKTSDKYTLHGTARSYPEFMGDNRDQRSLLAWASLWLSECLRVTKPGGYLLCFTDWRQLPVMTDAIQCGGWVWRGIVPWDKTEGSRPQRGWFRAQCEYVLTASKGSMGNEQEREVKTCLPGIFTENVLSSQKLHTTGKPLRLMKRLLGILPDGATVLDPFAGSGTTLLAAKERNLRSIGIEISPEYAGVIRTRLEQDVLPLDGKEVAA